MTCHSSTFHRRSLRISLDSTPSAAGSTNIFHGRLRCCCSCGQQASLVDLHCSVARKRFRNVPSSRAGELLAQLLLNSTRQPSLFRQPLGIDLRRLLTRLADSRQQWTELSSSTRFSDLAAKRLWYLEADAVWLATTKFSWADSTGTSKNSSA